MIINIIFFFYFFSHTSRTQMKQYVITERVKADFLKNDIKDVLAQFFHLQSWEINCLEHFKEIQKNLLKILFPIQFFNVFITCWKYFFFILEVIQRKLLIREHSSSRLKCFREYPSNRSLQRNSCNFF